MTGPIDPLDPTELYAVKFMGTDHVDVYLVYPTGAVRFVGPGEWEALTEAGVPLVDGGENEQHWKLIDRQAWASAGYSYRPGE